MSLLLMPGDCLLYLNAAVRNGSKNRVNGHKSRVYLFGFRT